MLCYLLLNDLSVLLHWTVHLFFYIPQPFTSKLLNNVIRKSFFQVKFTEFFFSLKQFIKSNEYILKIKKKKKLVVNILYTYECVCVCVFVCEIKILNTKMTWFFDSISHINPIFVYLSPTPTYVKEWWALSSINLF